MVRSITLTQQDGNTTWLQSVALSQQDGNTAWLRSVTLIKQDGFNSFKKIILISSECRSAISAPVTCATRHVTSTGLAWTPCPPSRPLTTTRHLTPCAGNENS